MRNGPSIIINAIIFSSSDSFLLFLLFFFIVVVFSLLHLIDNLDKLSCKVLLQYVLCYTFSFEVSTSQHLHFH